MSNVKLAYYMAVCRAPNCIWFSPWYSDKQDAEIKGSVHKTNYPQHKVSIDGTY